MSSKGAEENGRSEGGNVTTQQSNLGFVRDRSLPLHLYPGKAGCERDVDGDVPMSTRHRDENRDTNGRGSRRLEDAERLVKLRSKLKDDKLRILCDSDITPKHTNANRSPLTRSTKSSRAGSSARRNRGDLGNNLKSRTPNDLRRTCFSFPDGEVTSQAELQHARQTTKHHQADRLVALSSSHSNEEPHQSEPPNIPSPIDKVSELDDEATENGQFAADAGLSFDSDNGDTINDLALYKWSLSQSFDGVEVISGIWDRLFTFSTSMSSSNEYRHQTKPSQLSRHTTSSMDRNAVIEAEENTQFAAEAGLIYNGDDGDAIDDLSLCNASLSQSFSNVSSVGFSSSFDYMTYLRHRQADENAPDDVTKGDPPDDVTEGDPDSLVTNNAVALQDGASTRVSPITKMIRGYADVENRKTLPTKKRPHTSRDLPTTASEVDQHEMERRLHDLASMISSDWRGRDIVAPVLARRIRDFQFAREKRKTKYGVTRNFGILGIYDHLSRVKVDVQWAEDAAWRRGEGKPYLTWADFEDEKKEKRRRPYFTFFIVSICTAMMLTSFLVNDWKVEPLSVNPMIGPSAETLVTLGAKDSYLIVVEKQSWRLVTSGVLHAGLIHYGINMFALFYVAKAVESVHGFWSVLLQFLISSTGGTILSAIFLPQYITVGASGGILGLIGACLSDIILNWSLLFNEFVNPERRSRFAHAKVLVVLLLDVAVNIVIGLTPFVDNWSHVGGMVYGFLCGLSTIHMVSPRFFGDERRSHKYRLVTLRSIGFLVGVAGIITSSIVLFSGDGVTNLCPDCTYSKSLGNLAVH